MEAIRSSEQGSLAKILAKTAAAEKANKSSYKPSKATDNLIKWCNAEVKEQQQKQR